MKNKVNTDTKTKNKENSTFKSNVYELDSYEITKETCALINLSDDFTKTSAVHVRKIRRRSAWRRDFGCCDFVPNDLYPHAILAAVPCCGAALRN